MASLCLELLSTRVVLAAVCSVFTDSAFSLVILLFLISLKTNP